jgi:hypothetical protein
MRSNACKYCGDPLSGERWQARLEHAGCKKAWERDRLKKKQAVQRTTKPKLTRPSAGFGAAFSSGRQEPWVAGLDLEALFRYFNFLRHEATVVKTDTEFVEVMNELLRVEKRLQEESLAFGLFI